MPGPRSLLGGCMPGPHFLPGVSGYTRVEVGVPVGIPGARVYPLLVTEMVTEAGGTHPTGMLSFL